MIRNYSEKYSETPICQLKS